MLIQQVPLLEEAVQVHIVCCGSSDTPVCGIIPTVRHYTWMLDMCHMAISGLCIIYVYGRLKDGNNFN